MLFRSKADYDGVFDDAGVPMINYRGSIGVQYNPIAIAQFGLGNHDLYLRTNNDSRRTKCLAAANWMVENLVETSPGNHVWLHDFDWEYRSTLVAPWRSGLAQGQGLSLLTRAYILSGDKKYKTAALNALTALTNPTSEGGVAHIDKNGAKWIEEYIVDPPTHILNGFIWALWGIRDIAIQFESQAAEELWNEGVKTIKSNLRRYDTGRWSLYELSGSKILPMLASSFYHKLHIVQLTILSELTGDSYFRETATKWQTYSENGQYRFEAKVRKIIFKLLKY
jgi:heparosan-N-sulfate-glucuronate 5-epimerase